MFERCDTRPRFSGVLCSDCSCGSCNIGSCDSSSFCAVSRGAAPGRLAHAHAAFNAALTAHMAKPSEVEIATASSTYSQIQESAAHAASIAAHRQLHHNQARVPLYPFTRLKVASKCTRGHAHARTRGGTRGQDRGQRCPPSARLADKDGRALRTGR